MSLTLLLELLALVILLGCSAFFSSAETALFSVNPIHIHRLRRQRPRRADMIERLLATPTRLLSTILIGNTLVNVSAASLGYVIAATVRPGYGELLAIPIMTGLLLIFGEVTPKRLAMWYSVKLATWYAPVLTVLVKMFRPLRKGMEWVTRAFQQELRTDRKVLTEDEFMTVLEVGEEAGVLDKEERTMVDGIILLEETHASDVMTPRVDLVGIDLDDSPAEYERIARRVTFHYLPLYRGTLDNPVGFLDVPRYLLAEKPDIAAATLPPYFVPETAPLDALLTAFQREKRRVAFVVDEYGGTAGLLTRGDILEEIVDDVENEYRQEQPEMQPEGENRWLIDGSTSLEDINYTLDTALESEGADRIAGWVSAMAEHIPKVGETVAAQGCRVTVKRLRRQRITLVLLEKLETQSEAQDDGEDGDEP